MFTQIIWLSFFNSYTGIDYGKISSKPYIETRDSIDSKQSSEHFTKWHVSFVEIIWIIVSCYGDGALPIPVLEKDMPVVRIKCFIVSLAGETLGIRPILVDETFSSRNSPCCQDEEIYHPQLSDPFGNLMEELYRTSCCMACSNMWNRDVAACINICHMFLDAHNLVWQLH